QRSHGLRQRRLTPQLNTEPRRLTAALLPWPRPRSQPIQSTERFDGWNDVSLRVRSSDASGSLVVGPDYSLTRAIPVTVALSPQSATIAANGTQQFTATVANYP